MCWVYSNANNSRSIQILSPEAVGDPESMGGREGSADHRRVPGDRLFLLFPLRMPKDVFCKVSPYFLLAREHGERRKPRVSDEDVLLGILLVLYCSIRWAELPKEWGFGSGMTCWRRLRRWKQMGIWDDMVRVLKTELPEAHHINWGRSYIDAPGEALPEN